MRRDATIAVARLIKAELEEIETERAALLARQAEILRRRMSEEQRRQKVIEAETLVQALAKKLPRAKFEQKRMILEAPGARVTVNGRDSR